jgi:hypothetical protein
MCVLMVKDNISIFVSPQAKRQSYGLWMETYSSAGILKESVRSTFHTNRCIRTCKVLRTMAALWYHLEH